MREYPKPIKRLIREYAAKAYEAELGQALGELERQFVLWRGGGISAGKLSERIYAFTRGRGRKLWERQNAKLDDFQVAYAIATGLLPRDGIPAELFEALQAHISFYEHELA